MRDLIIQNSEGWYWPRNDGHNGRTEEEGSCWYFMKTHPDVPKKISQHVPNKGVVVQAGGNCGFYVKQYADIFNLVYTFEPEPVNFFCLNLNVTSPNVLKFQACLGDKHEGVMLGNFMPDVGATHVAGSGPIPTFRIDDLALQACDLIHLDIEGYELNALKGAIETINKFKPVIALEFYKDWAARYATTLDDIDQFLAELGYQFTLDEQGDRIYKFKEQVKVYDCFTFFNELDLLELRLEELYNTVDYFVIAEATSTHSGKDKPLYLKDNWDRYAKYHDKIRHIIVDDMPRDADPWKDENYQRNALASGFQDAKPEDLILISDLDEIPRADIVEGVRDDENGYMFYILNIALFLYRFNFLKVAPEGAWKQHNVIATRKKFFDMKSELTPQQVRNLLWKTGNLETGYHDDQLVVIEHAGWHFTFLGNDEKVKHKIENFAHHIETNVPQYVENLSVEEMIKNKCALLGPDGVEKFEYVKVDDYFPQTILNNLEKYKDWIIQDSEHTVFDFYKE
jgi:FkbM family methyltransferase